MAKAGDQGRGGRGAGTRKGRRKSAPVAPRHSARATRSAGQTMRSRLLDAASALFKAHGLNGTSITAIASASDAFPSQITYYFRTKEALFVEAACRDILHLAARTEEAANRTRTPKAYARAVADSVLGTDAFALFVEALTLARQRPDLVPQIARTIERLHVEAARAYAREITRHGWRTFLPPDVTARKFWRIALGVALEGHATGRSAAAMSDSVREVLGDLAEAPPAKKTVGPRLRLVTSRAPAKST